MIGKLIPGILIGISFTIFFYIYKQLHETSFIQKTVYLEIEEPLNFSDPEVLRNEIEKIKRKMQIDYPITGFPGKENEEKPSKVLRKLENFNELNGDSVIFSLEEQTNELQTMRYIMSNLHEFYTNMILYPYAFNHTFEKDTSYSYPQGALVTFNMAYPPGGMRYRLSNTTINIGKARGLFGIDIAILREVTIFENFLNDLFYDSGSFCSFFSLSLTSFRTCLEGKGAYQEYKKKNKGNTAFVYFSAKDVIENGLLNEDGSLSIGALIFPDHIYGSENLILNSFQSKGIEALKVYLKKGGHIIATGKSGYILEKMGLIKAGTYNNKKLIMSQENNRNSKITGCDINDKPYTENENFFEHLICQNYIKKSSVPVGSSFQLLDTSMATKIKIDTAETKVSLVDGETGLEEPLPEELKDKLYLVLHKDVDSGSITIINANPLFLSTASGTLLFNSLLYPMSKPLYLTSKVNLEGMGDNIAIPGGEEGVVLDVEVTFYNLDDKDITNFEFHNFLRNRVKYRSYPSECQNATAEESPKEIVYESLDNLTHISCNVTKLQPFSSRTYKFKIEIIDYTVTQQKQGILLMYPFTTYLDDKGRRQIIDQGGVKVNAELAAVLRGTLNPDPSSFYPLPGKGYPVDNVLKIENKEDSPAKAVTYVAALPLLTPVTDGSDQGGIARTVQLYDSYYHDNNYKIPFGPDDSDFDYVDIKYLNNKDVIMDAEWDSPVKPTKETRPSSFPEVKDSGLDIDILNINFGISVNSTNDVIKQNSFRNADRFFMHASQRLIAFVDITKEKGAKAIYPNGLPDEWKSASNPALGKKELLFARNDIYFYDVSQYQKPDKINDTFVFSVDKYTKPPASECEKIWGKAKPYIMVEGHFNSDEQSILKPNEWSNMLFQYCDRNIIDPTEEGVIEKYNLTDVVKSIHYLVPIKDTSIKQPNDLYGFTQINQYTGYNTLYKSLKFIYAHKTDIRVPANITRHGGKIEVKLNNLDVESENDITFSPDQVAFFKTVYHPENKTIVGYFKRGLMSNEAYGKDSIIGIAVENLKSTKKEVFTVSIYSLSFDLSLPETGYESYNLEKSEDKEFNYIAFISLPAIEIKTQLKKGNETCENSTLEGYETMEPFTRYGVYIQEMMAHRTLWSIIESHHQSEPGVQMINTGFSTISNLGISSIPFVEYVTTGSGLLIPFSLSTSRLEWKDIWGRHWSQPLRTVFPDIPPIPPPLKNFMMSTTFELLVKNGGKVERAYEWPSDEEAQIHLQVKFLNNYPKYFEVTRCKENEVNFIPEFLGQRHDRIFEKEKQPYELDEDEVPGDSYFIVTGGKAKYGYCYNSLEAYLQGQKLNEEDLKLIEKATTCSDSVDQKEIEKCAKELENIKTITKRKGTGNQTWIYSPFVSNYYPQDYLEGDMWDLTHIDYDDNALDKAYKYHMDNNLPNIDKNQIKPNNAIVQPIFKGSGYSVTYDSNQAYWRNGKYKGWWSDNLQNKDDTLVAGNLKSNAVSVDKEPLIKDSDWIHINDLKGNDKNQEKVDKIVSQAKKNIYVCLFNQHRVKVPFNHKVYSYLGNVNQNNIVPIIPDLDINDPRLYNFNCTGVNQYTPETISQADNVIRTGSNKDYLYFAANLRGGAKENFHVVANLNQIQPFKYQGMVKVNEGGRFSYWNPANGPNSYIIVDNPVNIIHSKRNDLSIQATVYPGIVTTFGATTYHLFEITDVGQTNLEWPFNSYYTNSFGFGDSTITVYIGGVNGSRARLNPGETTYARITFFNNAGFDWNMKFEAIDFVNKPGKPSSADQLLKGDVSTVKVPTKYNFMKVEFTNPEIAQYVTIEPSDHNVDVAPEFFDFGNINVVTIRDGFKGEYYYKISVKSNIPDKFKGKPIQINVKVVEEMFDRLPSFNDPTRDNFHDYHLEIPPLMIAVPLNNKVYYTNSYATNLKVQLEVRDEWTMDKVKYIQKDQIEELIKRASDKTQYKEKLLEFWNQLSDQDMITPKETGTFNRYKSYEFDFEQRYKTLPFSQGTGPDGTQFYVLAKMDAPQLEFGDTSITKNIFINYDNWAKKPKKVEVPYPHYRIIRAEGAWLGMGYASEILIYDSITKKLEVNPDQRLFPDDDGIIRVNFTLANRGSAPSYHTNYSLIIESNVTLNKSLLPENTEIEYLEGNKTKVNINYNQILTVNQKHLGTIYLHYKPAPGYERNKTDKLNEIPSTLPIVNSASAQMNLIEKGAPIKQSIDSPLSMKYVQEDKERVGITLTATGIKSSPKVYLNATANKNKTRTGFDIVFGFYKLNISDENSTWVTMGILNKNIYEDYPQKELKGISKITASVKMAYKVELYNENKEVLAFSNLIFDSSKLGMSKYDYIPLGVLAICLLFLGLSIICARRIIEKNKNRKVEDEVIVKSSCTKGIVKAPMMQPLVSSIN